MTTRKPKPVRAWATLSLLTGQINRCTDATRAECIDTCGFVGETDYKPVRVTIIPDGTPSQAAEVRRLKNALRAIHDVIETRGPLDESWRTFLLTQIDAALRGRRGAK